MDDIKRITILIFQSSIIVKGIEKKLNDLDYVVDTIDDFDRIAGATESANLFIMYIPADVHDSPARLKSLGKACEVINSCDRRLLLIGDPGQKNGLFREIPQMSNFSWIDRPIDMSRFETMVDELTRDSRKQDGERKKRILIVDDDPSYARMVREWIKDFYKADIVTAGMQAISFLLKVKEDDKVDLVLLDYEMPVVDGPQVLQMLRQEPATANIPVMFLTGNGTKEAVTRVMMLKPSGYILKSTTREDLLKNLRGLLN